MNITIAKGSGFCPGVKRADNFVCSLISKRQNGERIYTLGHLIHNRLYNEGLERQCVKSIEFSEVFDTFYSSPESICKGYSQNSR